MQYAFVEYAGNNITHWSFLDNEDKDHPNINVEGICSKIFLIADNDGVELPSKRSKQKKLERQEQLKSRLGEHFYVTQCREVENLLTKDIVKKVVLEMEKSNAKNLDFTSFNKKAMEHEYLGDFIEKNVRGISLKYRNEYGTIRDKVGFCKKALHYMSTKEDLSEEAITLTLKLIQFIQASNRPV